jgi:hypothetical protein
MTGIFPTSILGNSSKGIFDEGDRQVLHKGPPGRVHQHTHTHRKWSVFRNSAFQFSLPLHAPPKPVASYSFVLRSELTVAL